MCTCSSSNMVLAMGDRTGFNNKILVSEHGFKIGVNKLVNLGVNNSVIQCQR